jgi:hypothetical protein
VRRMVTVVLSWVMAVAVIGGSASAGSLTVRTDPNDTRHVPDISAVWSDVSPSGLYIRIGTWDRLRHHDAAFVVLLETRGVPEYDRIIEISGGECVVEKIDADGSLGEFIGRRKARFPGRKAIVCRVPTGWFAIRETVRFVVKSGFLGSPLDDRAPDDGRYIGL